MSKEEWLHDQLNEANQEINKLMADHVSKKALREWCEKNHWDDFICPEIKLLNMTKLLDQFCKEGES